MATPTAPAPPAPEELTHVPGASPGLAGNALSTWGVIFCIVAGAAPLYAMLFNVPLTVQGGGFAGPSAFVLATIVLVVFSVGYIQMARRIKATGGFYSFVTQGLGPVAGLGTGILIAACYVVFCAAIIGPTAYFAHGTFEHWFGVSIPTWLLEFGILGISTALAWFRIELTSRLLGLFLCLEVVGLVVLVVAVLVAGGDSGLSAKPLDPTQLFDNSTAVAAFGAGAVGIALFGAFWSWVGFEMAPNYAEEARDPSRTASRAMYGSVVGLGIIYSIVAFAFVIGWGPDHAAAAVKAQFEGKYESAFYPLTDRYVGSALTEYFRFLTITSGFAAQLAFYNVAARYLFSLGREELLPRGLARTHPVHRSPHVASMAVSVLCGLYMLAFVLDDSSTEGSLLKLGTWSPLLGVFGILMVQALVSVAIIRYFLTSARDGFHWFKTLIAPLLGCAAQLGACVLLLRNRGALSGAADVPFIKLLPWIDVGLFVAGAALALLYRARSARRYAAIGHIPAGP
jgi:amino acid transporter